MPSDIGAQLLTPNSAVSGSLDRRAQFSRESSLAIAPEKDGLERDVKVPRERGRPSHNFDRPLNGPMDVRFGGIHNHIIYTCRTNKSTTVEPTKSTPVYSARMALGKNIKVAREEKGWKMADLAKHSNVNLKTIDRLERRNSVRSQYAGKLAKVLGLTTDELVSADEETIRRRVREGCTVTAETDFREGEAELIAAFRRLPKSRRIALVKDVEAQADYYQALAEELEEIESPKPMAQLPTQKKKALRA